MSGVLITIEGGEGSGKTTLIEKLCEKLSQDGHTVIKTREPGGTPLGVEIRKLLLHNEELNLNERSELFLFLADRAHHVETVIKPALANNHTVLCDRFTDSTLAYQGLARDRDLDQLETLCNAATDNIKPHLTFYLDIDPKIGLERVHTKRGNGFDRIEKQSLDFHSAVRDAFLFLAKREPERIHILDAGKTPDEVFDDALKILNR